MSFDLHVMLRLAESWKALAASQASFVALFPLVQDAALVASWHAKLAPGGDATKIRFLPVYVPEEAEFPCVVVQGMDEPEQAAGMRHGGYLDGSKEQIGMVLRHQVVIHAFHHSAELCRALYTATMGMMLQGREWFEDAGYGGIEFLGGGDFQAAMDLMPQYLGFYLRVQRWGAVSTYVVHGVDVTLSQPFTYSSDVTVSGKVGGMKPQGG